jgi:hypothetical protein
MGKTVDLPRDQVAAVRDGVTSSPLWSGVPNPGLSAGTPGNATCFSLNVFIQ